MMYKKDKNLLIIVAVFLVIFFIMPPHDKIAQVSYVFNNLKLLMCNYETEAYIFHRNNAVYLTRMDNPRLAVKEMNKAIETLPSSAESYVLNQMYDDRARLKMSYGDYKGALDDFLKIPTHRITDYLTIAMLLKEVNKLPLAVSYCNKIIELDIKAYAGYACIADVYASVGKYEAAVMIYDLLIDRSSNKAKYYADRGMYKEKLGDKEGAQKDYEKAKELSPFVDFKSSITYDAIHPKKLELKIRES